MKILLPIIIIVILVSGYWIVSQDGSMNKSDKDSETSVQQNNEENMDGLSDEARAEAALPPTTDIDIKASAGTEKIFTLNAFSYGYSQPVIRVKRGDTVTINLTNGGGLHDWVVDEFGVATERIQAGETTSVTFVADKTGTFEFYCSVGNHRAEGMVGNLIVE